jgi:hypothetical protein
MMTSSSQNCSLFPSRSSSVSVGNDDDLDENFISFPLVDAMLSTSMYLKHFDTRLETGENLSTF